MFGEVCQAACCLPAIGNSDSECRDDDGGDQKHVGFLFWSLAIDMVAGGMERLGGDKQVLLYYPFLAIGSTP
jgi:hypothetical protein